jgi:hypothetical protein
MLSSITLAITADEAGTQEPNSSIRNAQQQFVLALNKLRGIVSKNNDEVKPILPEPLHRENTPIPPKVAADCSSTDYPSQYLVRSESRCHNNHYQATLDATCNVHRALA